MLFEEKKGSKKGKKWQKRAKIFYLFCLFLPFLFPSALLLRAIRDHLFDSLDGFLQRFKRIRVREPQIALSAERRAGRRHDRT
jgi:hypothetical protein